jgi:uncharacterized 2Fe-2S/4Fe-4S cluster protein (DUF4445 family)
MEKASGIGAGGFEAMFVSGGFAGSLDIGNAAQLGFVPPPLRDKARVLENSAVNGVSQALLRPDMRHTLGKIAKNAQYVELSTDAAFSKVFIESMRF